MQIGAAQTAGSVRRITASSRKQSPICNLPGLLNPLKSHIRTHRSQIIGRLMQSRCLAAGLVPRRARLGTKASSPSPGLCPHIPEPSWQSPPSATTASVPSPENPKLVSLGNGSHAIIPERRTTTTCRVPWPMTVRSPTAPSRPPGWRASWRAVSRERCGSRAVRASAWSSPGQFPILVDPWAGRGADSKVSCSIGSTWSRQPSPTRLPAWSATG